MEHNRKLASLFDKIADALEFKGELPFKISAYRKAARAISALTQNIDIIWKENKLRSIPGVGEGIAKKIDEFLKTGKMKKYESAMSDIPSGLLDLLSVQSMGPKTLKLAHEKLGVNSKEDLIRVIEGGSLSNLPGMGEKKVLNIKRGLEFFITARERISIGIAYPLAEEIMDFLKQEFAGNRPRRSGISASLQHACSLQNISPAGSLRRMRETIGDIDILVAENNSEPIMEHFIKFPHISRVLVKGTTKTSIVVNAEDQNIQVDLRVVPEGSYGAALQYFTGSKAHNIKLRSIAKSRGLKISEYGVFRGDKKIAGKTEEEVYGILGLPWIPPELREDNGEIEQARLGAEKLPSLIELNQILGDFHIHSNYSDGANSIKEIAQSAKNMGYKFIAITDHSKSAKYANGINEKELEKQAKEIEEIEKLVGIKILKGIELELKKDGTLDFSDSILRKLDIVIAALHTAPKDLDMTQAFISACKNPYIDIIAHPTGRLISRREGYKVDLDKLIKCARDTNTILEINCYPDRLDLSDLNAMKAKKEGIKLALGSDAHNVGMLGSMRFGVGLARRAWLEKEDVLNSYTEPWLLIKHNLIRKLYIFHSA